MSPVFGPDAVERLMGRIRPQHRGMVPRHFLIPTRAELDAGAQTGWLSTLLDPEAGEADLELQAVLEEIYAPFRDDVPDEALDRPEYDMYPGRARAKQRRATGRG